MLSIIIPSFNEEGNIENTANTVLKIMHTGQINSEIIFVSDGSKDNVLSWILSVLFALVTNLLWVFRVSVNNIREFLMQILSFYEGRLMTLALEEVFLFLFITILGFPSMITKVFAQMVVMIGNYVISKCWIFKKER